MVKRTNIQDMPNFENMSPIKRNWLVYESILAGHRPRLIGYHFSKDQILNLTQAIESFIQNESNPATIEEMKAYSKTTSRRSNGI